MKRTKTSRKIVISKEKPIKKEKQSGSLSIFRRLETVISQYKNNKKPKIKNIKSDKIKKCLDCEKEYSGKRNRCPSCYNIYQRNIQRDKSSTIEGYLKQLLSSMKNGKTRRTCDISIEELLEIYYNQEGKCALTGIEMTLGDKRNGQNNPYALSIDRIDNNLHYTKENVWLVLRAVNQFKNCYELGDVFKVVRAIYEENGFSNTVD